MPRFNPFHVALLLACGAIPEPGRPRRTEADILSNIDREAEKLLREQYAIERTSTARGFAAPDLGGEA